MDRRAFLELTGKVVMGTLTFDLDLLSREDFMLTHMWDVWFQGQTHTVARELVPLIERLKIAYQLSQHTGGEHNKYAATILSKAYQLQALSCAHFLDWWASTAAAIEAQKYGMLAMDNNLVGAAIIRRSLAYYYQGKHTQNRNLLQQHALPLLEQGSITSGLVISRLYFGLAVAKVHTSAGGALNYLQQGFELFPDTPEFDIAFNYSHLNKATLITNYSRFLAADGQYRKAYDAAHAHFSKGTMGDNLELFSVKAQAMIHLDPDEAALLAGELAMQAADFGSLLRMREAVDIYQGLIEKYPKELHVQQLGKFLVEVSPSFKAAQQGV